MVESILTAALVTTFVVAGLAIIGVIVSIVMTNRSAAEHLVVDPVEDHNGHVVVDSQVQESPQVTAPDRTQVRKTPLVGWLERPHETDHHLHVDAEDAREEIDGYGDNQRVPFRRLMAGDEMAGDETE